ncbi:MAG: hypothetical protein H0X34_19810 [Chthoniobacterales bacterium]|nr:hypothetical protein [Chthoniobacterales bacterium]
MRNKVPQVTLAFWLIKIAATTLGETGGDAVSMGLKLGYAVSTAIFFGFFLVTAAAQIGGKKFHPFLYWAVIVATTTVGTTTSDYLTRTAGLGYLWSSIILFASVLTVLAIWYFSLGSVNVNRITDRKSESFYWLTILCSNTLGTALGDCLADTSGFGYEGGALVFGGALALLAAAYFFTNISHVLLFWAAFILTRPLGATLGDLLTKPLSHGGLNLGQFSSTAVLAVFMIILILVTARKSEGDSGAEEEPA